MILKEFLKLQEVAPEMEQSSFRDFRALMAKVKLNKTLNNSETDRLSGLYQTLSTNNPNNEELKQALPLVQKVAGGDKSGLQRIKAKVTNSAVLKQSLPINKVIKKPFGSSKEVPRFRGRMADSHI